MRALLAMIGVAAALAGGCGSTEPAAEPLTETEYQQAITELIVSTGRASQLFGDVVLEPRPDCASETRELHAELERIVHEAAGLTPPDDVAALHQEFVAEARISVAAVGAAADRVEAGDLACGEAMNSAIYGLPSSDRAEQALLQIQEKGYFVFGE